jgi:ParB/RepB/Spo0J family partition protein
MSAAAPTSANTSEYEQVALVDLDTRYSELRLTNPKVMAALSHSIARHGVLQPLTVNRDGEVLVVLDGFKRHRVLSEVSDSTVPVRIVTLTAPQAKAALVTFNHPHRGVSELEEAWVVKSLVAEHKMLQKDVAELLGRHKSWVCRRLQLAQQLDVSVVEDIRLGLVSATVARELVRVPRGHQAQAADAIQQHGLTSRQTAQLVGRLLQASNQAGIDELLGDPMRFLQSPAAKNLHPRDARLSAAGGKVSISIDALTRQARITHSVVRSPTTGLHVTSDLEVLRPQIREATEAVAAVLANLNKFVNAPSVDA